MKEINQKAREAFDRLLDDPWGSPVANDVAEGLRSRYVELCVALANLEGQVMQARDGFGLWPYDSSNSMKEVVEEARLALERAILA